MQSVQKVDIGNRAVTGIVLGDLDLVNIDRDDKDYADIAGLMQSISVVGQTTPILVTERGDNGKYKVISGKRRVRAAQALGHSYIEAIIIPSMAEGDFVISVLSDNAFNKPVNFIKRAEAVKALLDNDVFKSQQEVADAMGVSQSTISSWLSMLQAAPEVQEAVAAGDIPSTAVTEAVAEKGKKARVTLEDVQKRNRAGKWKPVPQSTWSPAGSEFDATKFSAAVRKPGKSWEARLVIDVPLKELLDDVDGALNKALNQLGKEELVRGLKSYKSTLGTSGDAE